MRLDPSEGSSAVETSAAPPASFANVRLEIFFIDNLFLLFSIRVYLRSSAA
jgi:hypothetical protein